MVKSQQGGDIIKRVMLYYFFSILLLIVIANIAVWMLFPDQVWISLVMNVLSVIVLIVIFSLLSKKSTRQF
jgi:L-asparagine transporter-like permease